MNIDWPQLLQILKEARYEAVLQLGSAIFSVLQSMLLSGNPLQMACAIIFIVSCVATSGYALLRIALKLFLRTSF